MSLGIITRTILIILEKIMKKFTNVVMYFSAQEAGVSGIEIITGDDKAKVEEGTRRTPVAWG